MSDSHFSAAMQDAIRRANRPMEEAGMTSMVTILDDLMTDIESGSIGAAASASEIDAVADGSQCFEQDTDSTSGLDFYWLASRFLSGRTMVSVAAGHVTLAASQTNYVEVDRAGTVSSNTSGFTAGRLPLWTIVTGASTISTVSSSKPLLTLLGDSGVQSELLSAAAGTKQITVRLGDVSATGTYNIPLGNFAGTISRISLVDQAAIAANDTNYWGFGVINKGAAGSGSTVVVDGTAAANKTLATGGAGLSANVERELTLSGTPANLVVTAKNVLQLTITKTAAATTMTDVVVMVELVPAN